MTIRCMIIDDKPLAIDILSEYIRKIPFLELVSTTLNPIEGLSLLQTEKIDLVFLDIQMPEITGIQFLKIAGPQCKVILTTAYSEYAVDGFEYDVIDYLLKPVSFERFYQAVNKAVRFRNKQENGSISKSSLINDTDPQYLFVKTDNHIKKVDLKDILYIESLQNYIVIHKAHDKIISLQSLKKIEEQLSKKEFIKVHKSYIVNLQHISSIEGKKIFIEKILIPIGDVYRESFFNSINKK